MTTIQNRKLQEAFKLALVQCKICNIPLGYISKVKINTRAKSRWGLCTSTPNGFVIEITDRLVVDDVEEAALMDTLLHEMLHTVDGCLNHGTKWKMLAKRLNDKFGYHIKRCTSAEEKGLPQYSRINRAKYKITCLGCGNENYYMKKSRAVSIIEKKPINSGCTCGRCGSHNFRFEEV